MKQIPRGPGVISLERLGHWVRDINLCLERLSAILGISALRGSTGLRSMDKMIDSDGIRAGFDRDGRTANTLAAMLDLMITRGWMGHGHLRMD